MPKPINVEHAFNPELRQAQADFDAYLSTRPYEDEAGRLRNADGTFTNTAKIDAVREEHYDNTMPVSYEDMSMSELTGKLAEAEIYNDRTAIRDVNDVLSNKMVDFAEKNKLDGDAQTNLENRILRMIGDKKGKLEKELGLVSDKSENKLDVDEAFQPKTTSDSHTEPKEVSADDQKQDPALMEDPALEPVSETESEEPEPTQPPVEVGEYEDKIQKIELINDEKGMPKKAVVTVGRVPKKVKATQPEEAAESAEEALEEANEDKRVSRLRGLGAKVVAWWRGDDLRASLKPEERENESVGVDIFDDQKDELDIDDKEIDFSLEKRLDATEEEMISKINSGDFRQEDLNAYRKRVQNLYRADGFGRSRARVYANNFMADLQSKLVEASKEDESGNEVEQSESTSDTKEKILDAPVMSASFLKRIKGESEEEALASIRDWLVDHRDLSVEDAEDKAQSTYHALVGARK